MIGWRPALSAKHMYVAIVSCAGVGVLGISLLTHGLAPLSELRPASWVLLLLMLVTELVPVRVPRRNEQEEITTSTPFSFALLLTSGFVIAALGQALVSLVADLFYRKPLYKSLFNVAQYTLSFSAGAAVLGALSDVPLTHGPPFFTPGDLPAILAAALAFFLVNNALTGTVLALAQGLEVVSYLRSDISFRAATDGALVALAPIVVTAAQFSIALLPLFALPLLAVYIAGRQAVVLASVQERQHLFEKLSKVERSISHRAPLQDVLDAIVGGARELLGDDVVTLRLIDPNDAAYSVIASSRGLSPDVVEAARRAPIRLGAAGRAITEGQLVVIDDYEHAPEAISTLAAANIKAAMAAPVHEAGKVVGSLVVGSFDRLRTHSRAEQEALRVFAEHVSLALTDARTVEAMREAQRAKEMFLATVSHELKTPLTVIMATLHTIKKYRALPGHVRDEIIVSAYERGRDLDRLINQLLQGSRAELAGMREEVFLPEVIKEVTVGFEEAQPVVLGQIPDLLLDLDAGALRDALGILLENAVSHSPPNTEISIDARVNGGDVVVNVVNVGSLPEDLDRSTLFSPFQRGATSQSSGVGLGLYIAARLAESMGGGIDVDSTRDTVSFGLRFPLPVHG